MGPLSWEATQGKGVKGLGGTNPGKRESQSKGVLQGSLGGAAVWRLPLAQGTILETQDRVPRRAPGAWSLLPPLPVSLLLCLCVSLMNK